MSHTFNSYQRTLVDAFFHEQDQHLRKAFRERMEKLERREQLARLSGIRDEAVLDRLIELNIGPETLAALEIVPLALVAWADGSVQPAERETIAGIAKVVGIQPQDGRYPLLELWLQRHPGPEMLVAWKHYVQGLCERLDQQEIDKLRCELMGRAQRVAQAAGGFLGFGDKTSSAENAVLAELYGAFASHEALPYPGV